MKIGTAAKPLHTGYKLAAADLDPAKDHCAICGCGPISHSGIWLQRDPDVALLRCTNCYGMSASRMPAANTIADLYQQYYAEADAEKFTFHDPERLLQHILAHLQVDSEQRSFRVLELGGGDGSLVKALGQRLQSERKALHVEVSEVELFPGEDACRDGFAISYFRDLDQVSGQFDLVIASAVLHQIPDVHRQLQSLFSRVSGGGLFFARTAFFAPFLRVLGPLFDSMYPHHVHDLGCEFWNAINRTFNLPATLVSSAPSLVELQFHRAPLRAALSHLMKAPAHLELALTGSAGRSPAWRFVGGWEVFLRFNDSTARAS